MALRCGDISGLPGIESIRLRGGQSGVDNVVRWPYVAENRSFSSWVDGGELVFVTGISRHRSPDNLAECLYEGRECGIAGLVVLTGAAYIGQFPSVLSRLADELSIPVFEQPYSLPMVRVTEVISRAIVQAEQQAALATAGSLAEAMAACIGDDRIQRLLERYLAAEHRVLADNRDLLEAWLAEGGNRSAMADSLGCHRNTVRNRMCRLLDRTAHAGPESFKGLLLAHLMTAATTQQHEQQETL